MKVKHKKDLLALKKEKQSSFPEKNKPLDIELKELNMPPKTRSEIVF